MKQVEAQLLVKDADIETLETHHRVSIKAYDQKVKLLEYEHKSEQLGVQQGGEESVLNEVQEHEAAVIEMSRVCHSPYDLTTYSSL